MLFDKQRRWKSDDFRTYAKEMDLDMGRFETCMVSPRTHKQIQDDIQLALKLGATSTPTLFVNGYKATGLIDVDQFEKIQKQLKERQE